jgi:two-component system, OmpR family, phosphate regulon sensor histidine kinase PhoR
MRWLISLGAVWLIACLVIGAVGSRWLNSWYYHWQNELLARESALVAATVAATDWTVPPESDPRWKELETRWGIDVVPLFSAGSSFGGAASLPSVSESSSEGTTWIRGGGGRWRLSRVMAIEQRLPSPNTRHRESGLTGVRVTRAAERVSILGLWWGMCGSTLFVGSALILQLAKLQQRQLDRRQRALLPWVQFTQRVTNSLDASLPATQHAGPEHAGEDLELQLSIVRERVNGWLRDLQSNIQRSELVLGNLQEGVLAVDDNSRVLLANTALERLLGISMDNYLYRTMIEVIRVPRLVELLERVLETRAVQEDSFECSVSQLSLRVLACAVPLGNDRYGALVTVRDETPLRRVEQVRRDFVTNASHELKTPLAAIRAYAETLQMGAHEDRETCQQFLGGILAQADRIHVLINGMLQLARVQGGTATLERVRFDVCEAVLPCIKAAEAVAHSKKIAIVKSLPATPVLIISDPDSVTTVLSNLMSNAVRYTPSGGRIDLKIEVSEEQLLMSVQDTGVGIGKEDLSRIFERFYRVERGRSADSGGTGLGLSIVKHLTQALGGEVLVRSELHVGSCFEVRIPVR